MAELFRAAESNVMGQIVIGSGPCGYAKRPNQRHYGHSLAPTEPPRSGHRPTQSSHMSVPVGISSADNGVTR